MCPGDVTGNYQRLVFFGNSGAALEFAKVLDIWSLQECTDPLNRDKLLQSIGNELRD
jgi:hypothetical protein